MKEEIWGCRTIKKMCIRDRHCTPMESYRMFKNMNSKAMIPVHYKTFKISLENFSETYTTLANINDDDLKLIDIGETYKI